MDNPTDKQAPVEKQVVAPVEGEQKVEPQVETPVEKPVEEAKESNDKPTESPLPEKKEDKSKLGQVTSLVEKAGLSMKEIAEYAKANDGALDLDSMVKLKEEHGSDIASLIADQVKSIHAERMEASTKRDQEVYDQVEEAFKDITEQSGKETWAELAGWAKENVSTEHRTEINDMLAQGGLAAKLAVQELVSGFKESQGTQEYQEADLIEAETPAMSNGTLISKQDYNRELNKLLADGHQYGSSSEIAKLDARRSKSIQRGY